MTNDCNENFVDLFELKYAKKEFDVTYNILAETCKLDFNDSLRLQTDRNTLMVVRFEDFMYLGKPTIEISMDLYEKDITAEFMYKRSSLPKWDVAKIKALLPDFKSECPYNQDELKNGFSLGRAVEVATCFRNLVDETPALFAVEKEEVFGLNLQEIRESFKRNDK